MNKAKPKHIVLVTPIYPPKLGGPAQYAVKLDQEFKKKGYKVSVITYGKFEDSIPSLLRPFSVFLKVILKGLSADLLVSLDNCTLGLPAVLAAKILRIPSVVRIGGDALWEAYIEKHKKPITLPAMYDGGIELSRREKVMRQFTRWSIDLYTVKAFNSEWLIDVFEKPYSVRRSECRVVLNYAGPLKDFSASQIESEGERVFLWSARPIYLKNELMMDKCFAEVKKTYPNIVMEKFIGPQAELFAKMDKCYAVLLPSISDVSPNLIYESVQRGKPFLVTKYTGLPKEFKQCGVYVDPIDSADIQRGVIELMNAERYAYFKSNIPKVWKENTWENIADNLIRGLI